MTAAPASLFPHVVPAAAASPLCTVLVDAEEDFDWNRPVRGVPYDLGGMRQLADFHSILAAYGAEPTYLLTWPVMQDASVVAALRARLAQGRCRVGVQLHPWVTPPFTEAALPAHSFAGNLSGDLEEAKLLELIRAFRACFGEDPTIFRAGRYGLGPRTPALLEKHGFTIDTSLAPRTSFVAEAGPDFSGFDYAPFWFGVGRRLLELPLCRAIAGWGREAAARAYRWLPDSAPPDSALAATPPGGAGKDGGRARHGAPHPSPLHHHARHLLVGLMALTRCAERVTLSPEGNDPAAAGRLVASLLRRGQRVLALSLHSSSLGIGHNPYVRSRADLHHCYDRLSAMLDLMACRHQVRFVAAADLPALLGGPPPAAPDLAGSATAPLVHAAG